MGKENLLKLATYLMSGNLKADFDMRYFANDQNEEAECTAIDCGTVGCAAGHGPYAGLPKLKGESWPVYTYRVFFSSFPPETHTYVYTYPIRAKWRWCFSYAWESVDNTPEGAGKRILYLLKHGLPDDWYDQMCGIKPLCYLNETL